MKPHAKRCTSFRLTALAVFILLMAACASTGRQGAASVSPTTRAAQISPTQTSAPTATQGAALARPSEISTRTAAPRTTLLPPIQPAETCAPSTSPLNLLRDPGFEGGKAIWIFNQDPRGAKTEVVGEVFHSGRKSLRVVFDGSADVDYWHVSQDVPVEPNTTYRLQGCLKVEGILALSSVRLDAQIIRGEEKFDHPTPDLYTTQGWTPVSVTFTTMKDTQMVRIMLRRSGTAGLFPISGTAWVDDVSLVRLPVGITPSRLTLRAGMIQQVTASSGTPPYQWASSSPAVAVVQPESDTAHAQVTALSAGEAGITAVDAQGRTALLKLTTINQSAITVNAGQTLRAVPEAMFGSNVSYTSTHEYMPDRPVWGDVITDPGFIKDVEDLRLSSLRFPGGTESNYYDFSLNKGDLSWAVSSQQYSVVNGITTDQFIQFLRAAHIPNAMLTANVYKSGDKNWPGDNWISPQVAADWVAYVNHQLGFQVTYWELGNEVNASDDYPWVKDPRPDEIQVPGLTRDLYIQKIHEWSQAMKAVDPTIKIGAVAWDSPVRGGKTEWWNLPVIQQRANDIDFLIAHPYVVASTYEEETKFTDHTAQEVYAWIWATHPIQNLRSLLDTYAPARARKIEIQASEWGVVSDDSDKPGYDTLWNAVLNTDRFWDLVQEGTDGANIWNLCEWPFPSLEAAQGGRKYAQYHMLWMNRNRSGKWLVESQVTSPTFSAGPFGRYEDMDYVEAVEGVPYLSAYATVSEDSRRLYLIITNKSAEPQPAAIRLNGFSPKPEASIWQMTSAHWDDQAVQPATSMISNDSPTFTYTFPARSVTSFVLDE